MRLWFHHRHPTFMSNWPDIQMKPRHSAYSCRSQKELHQIKISFNRNRVVCECEHEHTVLCWAVMTWNVVHAIILTITEVFWQRHTPPPLTTCPTLQICLPAVSSFFHKSKLKTCYFDRLEEILLYWSTRTSRSKLKIATAMNKVFAFFSTKLYALHLVHWI